jgi:hypothetical protein
LQQKTIRRMALAQPPLLLLTGKALAASVAAIMCDCGLSRDVTLELAAQLPELLTSSSGEP